MLEYNFNATNVSDDDTNVENEENWKNKWCWKMPPHVLPFMYFQCSAGGGYQAQALKEVSRTWANLGFH